MKRIILISLVLALCTGGPALAADYPEKDLQGVIMWGAGGATDNVARAITPLVEPHLGQQIVLINKPGGTGAIATQYVYSRPANGYTLLYGAENPQLHGVLKLSQLCQFEHLLLVDRRAVYASMAVRVSRALAWLAASVS